MSIGLLVLIFVWNEFFFSINLTYVNAAPRAGLRGEFHDAGRTILGQVERHLYARDFSPSILGWFAQRSLVKGLTAGSVKG